MVERGNNHVGQYTWYFAFGFISQFYIYKSLRSSIFIGTNHNSTAACINIVFYI